MSTKNLARTALEPGRARAFQVQAQEYERSFRTGEQKAIEASLNEDCCPSSGRKRISKHGFQRDKLRPIERFLKSNVGRPWDKVLSEIMDRFDSRTLAGRHILFDHILNGYSVQTHPDVSGRFYGGSRTMWVDKHGILRDGAGLANPWTPAPIYPGDDLRRASEWLGSRAIFRGAGKKLHWAIPDEIIGFRINERQSWYDPYCFAILEHKRPDPKAPQTKRVSFGRGRSLSVSEREVYFSLYPTVRDRITFEGVTHRVELPIFRTAK